MGGRTFFAGVLAATFSALPVAVGAQDAAAQVLNTWRADEARQGAAVDGDHFYAIANARIGKYRRTDGVKVAEWIGDSTGRDAGTGIIHLNSCSVIEAQLVCAHSNFPLVPMASSIEIFDLENLQHVRSIPLGLRDGSLTWLDRHDGQWWAGFANYEGRGGEPGRDHRFTRIVKLNSDWQEATAYALPAGVIAKLAPHSTSGGAWGEDGLLYITGHDAREMYQLRLPDSGAVLEWVGTIAVPIEGQAWAFDRSGAGEAITVFGIRRSLGEVIAFNPPTPTE